MVEIKRTKSAFNRSKEHLKASICLVCNEPFLFVFKIENGMYCSKECRYKAHSKIISDSYITELKERKKNLALESWKNNDKRKEDMSKQFSKDPRLSKDYRKKAFASLPNECEYCGDKTIKKLIVHHKDRDWTNNDIENLQILCSIHHAKEHAKERTQGLKFKEGQIIRGVRMILDGLRIDSKDENFKDTPLRVMKSFKEVFEGMDNDAEIKNILSTAFPSEYEGLVIVEDICTFSMCPHHLLPVEYSIDVGYVSKNKALGISKLPRLVELLARRPVLQETLTRDIVHTLMKELQADGAMAVVKGKHMCMRMRGIKKPDSVTTTSCLGGLFKTDESLKHEFALLTNLKNK